MNKRTSPTQLPTTSEITNLFDIEAKRLPAKTEHFPQFDSVKDWLKIADITTDFFDKEFLSIDEISDADITFIKNKIVEYTLENSSNKDVLEVLAQVTSYLSEEDQVHNSDIIFVFGSPFLQRAEKAIELYRQGFAPKILFTGLGPHYGENSVSEADRSANLARQQGVPEEAILIENKSLTIVDNVKSGFNYLDLLNIPYKSIIQIMAWYPQRRAWSTIQKYSDEETQIIRVNANIVNPDLQQNNWYKNQRSIELVFNEFVKMKYQIILNSS